MTMIKHCAAGFLSILVLAGCEADKDKLAREKVDAIKHVVETRTSQNTESSSSQSLLTDNVDRCIVQMSENKAKLDAIQVDYAETQTVQSSDTHTLYSLINYQLTACKDARQALGN